MPNFILKFLNLFYEICPPKRSSYRAKPNFRLPPFSQQKKLDSSSEWCLASRNNKWIMYLDRRDEQTVGGATAGAEEGAGTGWQVSRFTEVGTRFLFLFALSLFALVKKPFALSEGSMLPQSCFSLAVFRVLCKRTSILSIRYQCESWEKMGAPTSGVIL